MVQWCTSFLVFRDNFSKEAVKISVASISVAGTITNTNRGKHEDINQAALTHRQHLEDIKIAGKRK